MLRKFAATPRVARNTNLILLTGVSVVMPAVNTPLLKHELLNRCGAVSLSRIFRSFPNDKVFDAHHRSSFSRRAKYHAYLLALLLANPVTTLPGQTAPNTSQRNNEPNAAPRIAEIVASAWNKNDSETLASLFLPDAVLIMPTGSAIQSSVAIKQRIIDERNGKLKHTTLGNTIAGVSLPSGQAAIVR